MEKIAEYRFTRWHMYLYGIPLGVLFGLLNLYMCPELAFDTRSLVTAAIAILAIIVLHEGVHGIVAWLLGYNPTFGCKPPAFAYVTFSERIPRNDFFWIAIAPLVVLDVLFGMMYALRIAPTFFWLCVIGNSVGAMADVWIIVKLFKHLPQVLVQDTKTGIEIWFLLKSEGERNEPI
jgi:hypothetical protein